ncbi:MAG: hypothetical protein ABSC37_22200 [Xanthobacteraceae bacterium]
MSYTAGSHTVFRHHDVLTADRRPTTAPALAFLASLPPVAPKLASVRSIGP